MKMTKTLVGSVVLLLVALALISFKVGFETGRRYDVAKKTDIVVRGCGLQAQFPVAADRSLALHKLTTQMQPLPSMVNGALVKASEGSYYVRLSDMLSTNGFGRLPLFGGDSVLFVHMDD